MRKLRENSVFFLIVMFLISPLLSMAQEEKPKDIESTMIKAINKVKPSVVKIETITPSGGNGLGSGVILKENGFIITNNHVLRNSERIVVEIYNGKKFNGALIGTSPRNDLAVIKINAAGLKVPKWGNSQNLQIGQTAIAIGNPYKFEGSVSQGIISALDRRIPAAGIIYKDLIQTDAAINPGNSGGALIDSKGRVIGINTLVYSGKGGHSATGLGFAIPIHRALQVARQLISKKQYFDPRPWIGVQGMSVTREMAEMNILPTNQGVLITGIQPVSPAERAGLQKGDIVIQVNDKVIKGVDDFKQLLSGSNPGDEMTLKVWREEKLITISMKVSHRAVAP
ncbi:MAG: S1C family serine protease [Vulcanimicrobiota bacterium]